MQESDEFRQHWKEAGRLLHQSECDKLQSRLIQVMTRRLERVGMLEGSVGLIAEGQSDFWDLVLNGLEHPMACDQLHEKLSQSLIDLISGATSSSQTSETLTGLYDDAVANVEATMAVERHFLLMAASAASLSGVQGVTLIDDKTFQRDVLDRLAEHPTSEQPVRPDDETFLRKIEWNVEFSRAVLRADANARAPTFWELANAGLHLSEADEGTIGGMIYDTMKEIVEGQVSCAAVAGRLGRIYESCLKVADMARNATAAFTQLTEEIQASAAMKGVLIAAHLRTESWRRLNPDSARNDSPRL